VPRHGPERRRLRHPQRRLLRAWTPHLGKGSDDEAPLEQAELAVATFVDWFTERALPQYGGITCAAILGDDGGKPDVSRCGQLLADAWARILLLLTEQGLDPAVPREE
jgi:hypothetical protein